MLSYVIVLKLQNHQMHHQTLSLNVHSHLVAVVLSICWVITVSIVSVLVVSDVVDPDRDVVISSDTTLSDDSWLGAILFNSAISPSVGEATSMSICTADSGAIVWSTSLM